ncbi:APC amino acid permease [Pluteus cervinus]|uniref:APC amino acid permease n=1 Tax=Pluteus cervinus TaxID=181527 RepID=A0ACD3AHZ5_9AGAR|nr:APC amino acid permease [Pluteus cervinus]
MPTETEPLLVPSVANVVGNATDGVAPRRNGLYGIDRETYDALPGRKRQLGSLALGELSTIPCVLHWLTTTYVFVRGIYATPSIIFRMSGSVGGSLVTWLLGSVLACVGTAVYIELGTGLPRSGGDKNYLEFTYRKPRFLATCIYAAYILSHGPPAANSVVFGEYFTHALGLSPSPLTMRLAGLLCLTASLVVHGCFPRFGLRLQNTLGFFKFILLSSVAFIGLLYLVKVPGFELRPDVDPPDNLRWEKLWEGEATGINAHAMALYYVLWSYTGYHGANSVLSEVENPVRTLSRALPIAMALVTCTYLLVNMAYFGVVSKADIIQNKSIIAALFFRNLFGPTTERALSGIIAISVFGNVLATMFSYARIVQEFGREGILPWSSLYASNKPFDSPFIGLASTYLPAAFIVLAIPAGDIYVFAVSLTSYCNALVMMSVSLGLLFLHSPAYRVWNWNPPFRAPGIAVVVFVVSNFFLVVLPLIPPTTTRMYERLPYWSHPTASLGVVLLGVTYWYIWGTVLPWRRRYKLEREWVIQDDGISRFAFRKVAIE